MFLSLSTSKESSLALDSVESQNTTTVEAILGLRCFQKGFLGHSADFRCRVFGVFHGL